MNEYYYFDVHIHIDRNGYSIPIKILSKEKPSDNDVIKYCLDNDLFNDKKDKDYIDYITELDFIEYNLMLNA